MADYHFYLGYHFSLVVSTHLKNISQVGNLPQVGVKQKMKPPPRFHIMDLRLLDAWKKSPKNILQNGGFFHGDESHPKNWWFRSVFLLFLSGGSFRRTSRL